MNVLTNVRKTCSKCGVSKPLLEFNKDGSGKHGVRGTCKECEAACKFSNKVDFTRITPHETGTKFCKSCGVTKPVAEFSYSSYSKDGLYSRCKKCDAARCVARRAAIRETNMNNKRFSNVFHDLSEMDKRVFSFVPCEKPWPATDITREMHRSGVRIDVRTVAGVINSLKAVKLIVEPYPSNFKRARIDPEIVKAAIDEWRGVKKVESPTPKAVQPAPEVEHQVAPEAKTEVNVEVNQENKMALNTANAPVNTSTKSEGGPIEILSELSAHVLALVKSVQDVAERIDAAAILLDEQNKAREADTAKLRQLQVLLKSLGE